MNPIPREERLIVALDVPDAAQARALVEKLGDSVRFYKVGLELFSAGGYFELIQWLTARGNKVVADLKLYDIPETVRRAVANLRACGASFLTVHGHRSVMAAAAKEKGPMKVLAVTVLTSFDQRDLDELGTRKTLQELVLERAAALGWAARTDKEGWVLARDAAAIHVADIYRAFVFDTAAVGVPEADLALNLREYSGKEKG